MSFTVPTELQGAAMINIEGLDAEGRVWMCFESQLRQHFEVHPSFLSLFGTITCDDGTTHCSDSSTCCRDPYGGYGCCPSPGAQCCSDLVHCCPSGESCDNRGDCINYASSNVGASFAIVAPTRRPAIVKEPPLESRYVATEAEH